MAEALTLNMELTTPESSRPPSLFSYDSTLDAAEMLKEENGRKFNNQNDTYYLPAGTSVSFLATCVQPQSHPILPPLRG
jgi:hypothetical protein